MKPEIKPNAEGLLIEISEIEGKEKNLLSALQACQNGSCSCPTDEYKKLYSIDIENSAGRIYLQLKAKPGQCVYESEIRKCLDHTEKNLYSGT